MRTEPTFHLKRDKVTVKYPKRFLIEHFFPKMRKYWFRQSIW